MVSGTATDATPITLRAAPASGRVNRLGDTSVAVSGAAVVTVDAGGPIMTLRFAGADTHEIPAGICGPGAVSITQTQPTPVTVDVTTRISDDTP